MESGLKYDDWLAELEALTNRRSPDDAGLSMEELADQAGVSERTMRERVKRAQKLGRIRVGFRSSLSLIGRATKTPVYTVIPAAE